MHIWQLPMDEESPSLLVDSIVPPTKDFIISRLVRRENIFKKFIVLYLVERWIFFDLRDERFFGWTVYLTKVKGILGWSENYISLGQGKILNNFLVKSLHMHAIFKLIFPCIRWKKKIFFSDCQTHPTSILHAKSHIIYESTVGDWSA